MKPDDGITDYRWRPDGCEAPLGVQSKSLARAPKAVPAPSPLPPVTGEITIPVPTTPRELARLLKQSVFLIIGDLMKAGVFAKPNAPLTFEAAAKVARWYGYEATRGK